MSQQRIMNRPLLAVNLVGDIYNVVSGTEPRAAIGIPIVLIILAFIATRETRQYFRQTENG